MPVLTLRSPGGPATSHKFEKDLVTIGRAESNDLVLHDLSSSRHHAQVLRRGDGWALVDLGSRNGTCVGGVPINGEFPLRSGEEFTVGSTSLTFTLEMPSPVRHGELTTDSWIASDVPRAARPRVLVGRSPATQSLLATIDRVASATATVLVRGESGSGKELVAHLLHERSNRRAKPFVVVNCPALPGSLAEAELFGVERGVATGVDFRKGKLEEADGGTVFLDEVGDLDLGVQAKLLRFLQDRLVERVGSRKAIQVDVRVVAATHHDLDSAIAAGRFRHDLYHRLAVVTLNVPPLRERKEDIPLLAAHFLKSFATGGRELSPEALSTLLAYHWPGNVRQLEGVLEEAHLMAEGTVIGVLDLPQKLRVPLRESVVAEPGDETAVLSTGADLLLARIVSRGESFWDVIAEPFLRRELSRDQVRAFVALAHEHAGGSYKAMARLFRIEEQHKKLLDFLNRHELGVRR